MLTFGNERIDIILTPQRTPKNIKPLLESIKAGGGTPLREALLQTVMLINKQSFHYECCHLTIFTDGRSRDDMNNINIPCDVVLVDTENTSVKLGLVKRLSNLLNAQYIKIDNTIN